MYTAVYTDCKRVVYTAVDTARTRFVHGRGRSQGYEHEAEAKAEDKVIVIKVLR